MDIQHRARLAWSMQPYDSLLLEVWREACRHTEIERAVDTFAALLARQVPLAALGIVRFDRTGGALELCGFGGPGHRAGRPRPLRELRTSERRSFERWVGGGEIATELEGDTPLSILAALVGDDGDRSWWAGPLLT